jgi:cation transporter-like permease
MTLITLILILLGLGAAAWLIDRAPFENATFKQLIVFVLIVVAVVVVLHFFGVWSAVSSYRFHS